MGSLLKLTNQNKRIFTFLFFDAIDPQKFSTT